MGRKNARAPHIFPSYYPRGSSAKSLKMHTKPPATQATGNENAAKQTRGQ